MKLEIALLMLPGLLIGLTVHEFAHAWVASLLGDNFARRQGRVSLNPFRHLSLLGTLAIFLLPMGWAKPVPVNLYNFKRPRRDYLLTSLAGPAANVLLVGLCVLAMLWTRHTYSYGPRVEAILTWGNPVLRMFAIINIVLATVNLLPIPPLDGSKIWPCLLPGLDPAMGKKVGRISLIVLVVLLVGGFLKPVFQFAVEGVFRWIPSSEAEVFKDRLFEAQRTRASGRFPKAEALYSQAITINGQSWQAFAGRAGTRMFLKKFPEALADYDRAIQLDPGVATTYVNRARIEECLGMNARAQADMARAVRLGYIPDDVLGEAIDVSASRPILSPFPPIP